MDAEDSILGDFVDDDSAKRHPLKEVVDLLEDTVRVVNVFIESFSTLLSEAQVLVHISVLMVASEKEDLARVLQLQGEQETNDFERLTASVDVVAQEDVIETADIASLLRCPPDVKEAHQVVVVAVDVAEDFDGRLQVFDQHWLCMEHLSHFINELKDLFLLNVEGSHNRDSGLAFSWSK